MSKGVEIRWSYPKPWDTAKDSNQGAMNGVYQTCRTWAGSESLLYVGLVKSERRAFYQRMNEHRKEWINEKRGAITYRFGIVKPLRGLEYSEDLIEEVEGALILELQPPYNRMKKRSFSLREELVIASRGNRGFAPPSLDTAKRFD